MSLQVSSVPPDQIDTVFLSCLPMIERALRHGAGDSVTVAQLYAEVKSEESRMWVIHDTDIVATLIWGVHEYPNKRTLFVEVIAGTRLDEWREMAEAHLRELADRIGADTIEASCRFGLMRKLKDSWRPKAVLMEMIR
jgi:hypothetical protein